MHNLKASKYESEDGMINYIILLEKEKLVYEVEENIDPPFIFSILLI